MCFHILHHYSILNNYFYYEKIVVNKLKLIKITKNSIKNF